eukprot:29041-Pelagococcus_subviridis.AAC.7
MGGLTRQEARSDSHRSPTLLPVASLRPSPLAFNPDTPGRLSTPLLTPFNYTPTSLRMDPRPRQKGDFENLLDKMLDTQKVFFVGPSSAMKQAKGEQGQQ